MPTVDPEQQYKTLPPPWDRIFSLGTRTFVWTLLLAVLYILRPFFLLIFLTFVFAYIQAHGVEGLQYRVKSRALRVTIVGLVFLGTILATVFTLAPQVEEQGSKLLSNYQTYIKGADDEINEKLKEYPQIYDYLSKWDTGGVKDQEPPPPALVKNLVESVLGFASEGNPIRSPRETLTKVFEGVSSLLGYVGSFLLSLLFSFLIVLDLPKLRRSTAALGNTKVGFIYHEVAENIATFAKVLGRALEAQLFIAVCNTILTSIGIWILGITNIPVLAAIVFLCSFIPVAGVFISSVPICLLALQNTNGGFGLMLLAIGVILLVHTIETYILNPKIYGHHMRMNPVLVLIVLTIGGKLIGVWGLVLGIPIVNYFFRHAIRYPKDQPVDLAA